MVNNDNNDTSNNIESNMDFFSPDLYYFRGLKIT